MTPLALRVARLVVPLAALLALPAGCGGDGAARGPLPADLPGLTARFQARLDGLRSQAGFPGATAAFVLADGRAAVVATGVADREANTPMPLDARMPAGSVGKSFVGATALALAKEGRLDLDARVETWLGTEPWFARLPNGRDMTLRQLLTHSSGLPDHIKDPGLVEAMAALRAGSTAGADWYLAPDQAIGIVLDKPPLFAAGQGFSYTDTGYILVGLVIEKVTGGSAYDEIRRRFLGPLRLELTLPSDRRAIPGLVAGYVAKDNPLGLPEKVAEDGVMAFNPASEYTGGGLASNPRDLAHWAKELYEGRAFAGPYVDDLLVSVEYAGVPGTRYGLGVILRESPLGRHYGHSGWFPGYVTRMVYFPDRRVAVAVQVNTDVKQDVTAHALALAESILM